MSYTVYFSHGKDSGPDGLKIQYLKKIVHQMHMNSCSIDYRFTKNPDKRVKHMLNIVKNNNDNIILYGSSMGAYVSTVASKIIKPLGLFLCAPAFYLKGYKLQEFDYLICPIVIVHGKNDTIVPYKNSIKFAEKKHCDLHVVEDGHYLTKSENIISKLFKVFLEELTN